MASHSDQRHRFGQHYTPRDVAKLLAAFAVRSHRDSVFDPACGDGRLLGEAASLKRLLAPKASPVREPDLVRALDENGSRPSIPGLYGVDRSPSAISQAQTTGAAVGPGDFFDFEPGGALTDGVSLPIAFDAVIGNPPYIRQELLGSRDKRRIENRMRHDRKRSPEIHWPEWSGRSDIYVYFFAHAARFLRNGGRLVFLTASSWLDVAYGAPLREFLLENFRIVAIVESGAESFFTDASINTVITVLERETIRRRRELHQTRFVRLLRPLSEMFAPSDVASTEPAREDKAIGLARLIERAPATGSFDAYRIRSIRQSELSGAGRPSDHRPQGWGKFIRADDVYFSIIDRGSRRLRRLGDFARVRFGLKTGANEFFYVKDSERIAGKGEQETSLLKLQEVASVRRGITTGANDFFYLRRPRGLEAPDRGGLEPIAVETVSGKPFRIQPAFLAPVVFSLKDLPQIVLSQPPPGRLLFNCSVARPALDGPALDYVRAGERAGIHRRPTCAGRNPWYAIAREMKPAPLILPAKVGERWLVAMNRAGAFQDKKLYGVYPRRGIPIRLLAALLNSTWARYCAEVTCRQLTGAQAIADIDVVVAEGMMIPDPRSMSKELRSKLQAALTELSRRPVVSVFEEVKRPDRRRLDELVLEAIGFTRHERGVVLDQLYEAVTRFVRQRLARARSLGRNGGAP
jgi:Eco57I restriction-modification methylase